MSKYNSKKSRRSKSPDYSEQCTTPELIKVVVIGESGAGKSNLIHRLVDNRFDGRSKSTIGIDFALFEFQLPITNVRKRNHQPVPMRTHKAQIWDTAGQERYRSSMTKIFYRDVAGALLVFDLTKREHFSALTRWLREIRTNVHHIDGDSGYEVIDQIPIVLIGNKVDQQDTTRQIDEIEGHTFAKQHQLSEYVETSAKTGFNVNRAFMTLFQKILQPSNVGEIRDKSNKKVHREQSIKLTQDKYYLQQRKKHQQNHGNQRQSQQQKDRNKCNC